MKEKHKKILNTVLTLVVFLGAIIGIYFILKRLGITDQESLQQIIKNTGAWAPIFFLILQIFVTTLLSVIPGTSMTFLIIAGIIFDNIWLAIFLSLAGVWISSILMFVVGKTLGEKIAQKLVGKENLLKAQNLIDTKAKIYLPLMFVFPFFPDDGLCLAAGLTKMKYRYFIPVVIITRSIGVLAAVLSSYYHSNIFNFLGLKNLLPIEWFLLVNVLLFDLYVIFKLANRLEKRINEKKIDDEDNITTTNN